MDRQSIRHSGVIAECCDNGSYLVKIESKSACSACHAKNYCNAADMQDKIIEAQGTAFFEVGEYVFVEMDSSLAGLAVFLSFGIPFIFMITALLITYSITGSEVAGGIVSLVSLVPAYFLIFILKKYIEKKFKFKVVKN